MMNFLKKKYKSLIALAVTLAVGCVGLFLALSFFNVNVEGKTLSYTTQSGAMENLEAISTTFDGNGFFLTTHHDEGNTRNYSVKKVGRDGEVQFESKLEQQLINGIQDTGVFTFVTGVTENRAIAFTATCYYLYEVTEDGLRLLDAHRGMMNIGAGSNTGVKNFAFDVYDDVIDIYSLDNRGNGASLMVFIEKTTIKGDEFVGSACGEILKASTRRFSHMGAQGNGIAITEDHENVIVSFTSAKASMFKADLSAIKAVEKVDVENDESYNTDDVKAYNANVKTISVGLKKGEEGDGATVTAAQYDGNNGLYVFSNNKNVYRLSEEDFNTYDNEDYQPNLIASIGEVGNFATYDVPTKTLFAVNEDGNTVYSIDTEGKKVNYSVSLKFKTKNMVLAEGTNSFVCHWQDSVTDKFEFTMYNYSDLERIDISKVGKIISIIASIIAFVLAIIFAFMLVLDNFAKQAGEKCKWFFSNVWKSKWVYIIMLPSFTLLFIFSIYPSISAIVNSFFEYELGKPKVFVGFANYEELIVTNSGLFLEIARNTVLLVGTYLFTQVVPPVIYAYMIMLLRNKNSVKVIRWFMYIPGLLPTIAAMLMWRYGIYGINPNGALNIIIENVFGGTAIPFLGHSDYAIWSILFIGFPWVGGFLLFYGALMTVPTEVYDACELEGCGLIKRFFVIDLPFIMGQVKYVSIGAVIAGVKSVGRIMATTGGQMGTMTLMYKLYDYLNKNQYGMASTIAVIMVLLLAGISLARVRKMLKKENSYD